MHEQVCENTNANLSGGCLQFVSKPKCICMFSNISNNYACVVKISSTTFKRIKSVSASQAIDKRNRVQDLHSKHHCLSAHVQVPVVAASIKA